MWKLPSPDVAQANSELTVALTYADGTPLYALDAGERAALAELYNAYDANLGHPDPFLLAPSLSQACKAAIEAAYREVQDRGRLSSLRSRLTLHVSHCPLCGFGELRDLDHYLPKSVYHALAIYSRNLIPTCSTCNGSKRAYVGDTEAHRFVHAYLSVVPNQRFLFADVAMAAGALKVTYRIDGSNIEQQLAERLEFQLERLKLNDRYEKQANIFLFGQRTGILQNAASPAGLQDFLIRSAGNLETDFGLNDWRAALFYGLAECQDFCNEANAFFSK